MLFNKTKLIKLLYCRQALRWKKSGWLSDEWYSSLLISLTPRYKTTNIFLRMGLFLLTFVVCVCSLGLVAIFFRMDSAHVFAPFCIIAATGLYILFKKIAADKSWYANGIDDAISYIILALFIGGCLIYTSDIKGGTDLVVSCFVAFVIMAIAVYLMADKLVATCCFGLLLCFIFHLSIFLSPHANLFLPFLMMTVSLSTWWMMKQGQDKFFLLVYHDCFEIIQLLSLITFYLSGNYFIIHEAGIEFFNSDVTPLGWLFWFFTCVVPVAYLVIGIKFRNRMILNAGLILLIVAAATVRYYHSILPLEIALIIGGVILLLVSRYLLVYLREPRNGFTKEEDKGEEFLIHPNLEAIAIAQVMTPDLKQQDENKMEFGGGKFGGGGAGGDI